MRFIRPSRFRPLLLLVGFLLVAPVSSASTLALNGVMISEEELLYYLKERLNPEVYESALAKPDGVKNALTNLYVIRRAADIAAGDGLVDDGEVAYQRLDAGLRVALEAFISDRVSKELEQTDWQALADERYLAEQDRLGPKEQVRVSHVLISSRDRSFTEMVQQLGLVQEAINAGTPFHDIVRQYSDDPSAELNEGDIGFIRPQQTEPEFDKAAFALTEPGQVSEPVLTSYGVHIIKFHERRNVKGTPQDVVQSRLIKKLKRQREKSLRGEVLQPFRAEAWTELENLDEQSLAERLLKRLKALE